MCLPVAGRFLEIFGRKNNLRNFWTSLGNEATGAGRPPEEAVLMAQEAAQLPDPGKFHAYICVPPCCMHYARGRTAQTTAACTAAH